MKNLLLIITASLLLTGCFLPQVSVVNCEDDLEIELEGIPRSLLYYKSESETNPTIYYAIEISESQYEQIVSSWKPILVSSDSSSTSDWDRIGKTEIHQWVPNSNPTTIYSKELNKGGRAIAQYSDGWMYVIKNDI